MHDNLLQPTAPRCNRPQPGATCCSECSAAQPTWPQCGGCPSAAAPIGCSPAALSSLALVVSAGQPQHGVPSRVSLQPPRPYARVASGHAVLPVCDPSDSCRSHPHCPTRGARSGVYVRGALRWTAQGRSLPGQCAVSEPTGPRASPRVPHRRRVGLRSESRPAALPTSRANPEVPPGRVPARSFGIGRRRQGDEGTGGQLPHCPARRPARPDAAAQEGCGRPHASAPARGRVSRDCRRARSGLAIPRVPAGRRGRRLRERASAAPPRGRGCRGGTTAPGR